MKRKVNDFLDARSISRVGAFEVNNVEDKKLPRSQSWKPALLSAALLVTFSLCWHVGAPKVKKGHEDEPHERPEQATKSPSALKTTAGGFPLIKVADLGDEGFYENYLRVPQAKGETGVIGRLSEEERETFLEGLLESTRKVPIGFEGRFSSVLEGMDDISSKAFEADLKSFCKMWEGQETWHGRDKKRPECTVKASIDGYRNGRATLRGYLKGPMQVDERQPAIPLWREYLRNSSHSGGGTSVQVRGIHQSRGILVPQLPALSP